MVNVDELYMERDEKRHAYNKKIDQKLNVKKEIIRNKIDAEVDIFSKSHTIEETRCYRKNLEDDATLKINKLIIKAERKKGRYFKKTDTPKKVRESNRIWEIDFLRGIAIWGMMVDHFIYDFYDIFNQIFVSPYEGWLGKAFDFASAYWVNDVRVFVRLFGVALFVFLCGVSAHFSKNNFKRALGLMALGACISLASIGVAKILDDDSFYILLSTILSIGVCLFIYSTFELIFKLARIKKYYKWFCLAFFLVGTALWTYFSCKNFLSHENEVSMMWRRIFYIYNDNAKEMMMFKGRDWAFYKGWTYGPYSSIEKESIPYIILGLRGYGADWLGLFPYLNYIFLGGFIGQTVYKDRKSIIHYFYRKKEDTMLKGADYLRSPQGQLNAKMNKILAGIIYPGKHTLFVYVFHQPIFILLMAGIISLTGYKLDVGGMF
jgi:uncharacterized membrane protein